MHEACVWMRGKKAGKGGVGRVWEMLPGDDRMFQSAAATGVLKEWRERSLSRWMNVRRGLPSNPLSEEEQTSTAR